MVAEKLIGNFATHAHAVAAGKYKFVYGPIKKLADITVPLREVDQLVGLSHPNEELTVAEVYNRFGGLMLDLPAHEAYGAVHADDPADFPVVVIWSEGGKFWVAIRAAGLEQRYLFVSTRDADEVLPPCCRYLLRVPTAE